jgi:phosphopantetheinyl transferase (holo-ACP synthase)
MKAVFFHIQKKRNYLLLFVLFVSLIGTIPSLSAAKRNYLRLGASVNIPSISAKAKLFKKLKAKPVGSIAVRILTQRRGSNVRKIETYYLEELWLRDQLAGTWINDVCTVSVYKMTLPVPGDVNVLYAQGPKRYVLKKDYEEWRSGQKKSVEYSDEKIVEWLQYLTNEKFSLPAERIKKGKPRKTTTKRFKSENSDDVIYVIQPLIAPDIPIIFRYKLNNSTGRNHKKNMKAILSSLASITFYKSSKKVARTKERIVTKNKKKNIERSPDYIASKEAVIKAIRNLEDWWYLETDNFVMVANIKNKKTTRELAENLEKSRRVFTEFYPLKKPLDAVSVAKMFETRKGYLAYLGPKYENTGGLWVASKKELVVSPMDWGTRKQRRQMMAETTMHEAFHQYIFFATGKQSTATWFNEGNACFFSGIKQKGSRMVVEGTRRFERAKKYIPSADIEKLIHMSQDEYYSNMKVNYAVGYGLLFFLHKGAPVMKKKNKYHEIPMKYYNAVIETRDPKKATDIAWAGVDMKEFTKEFRNFWKNKTLMKKALRYDPLKEK